MKKYSSGSFVDAAVRIYGSEADTISSFPASIIADGENASAIIYGNMQQSGTPTPASPIFPSECGELVSGSYTLPIVCGGVTISIDLSDTQSTRQINKLELTGQEDWGTNSNCFVLWFSAIPSYGVPAQALILCSHYQGRTPTYRGSLGDGYCMIVLNTNQLAIRDSNVNYDETAWKQYLADQYSNGTPVTIWYVLDTPTTTTLNEPIRKIGDYDDSVAAAAIPTTAGSQTFNVNTTLKPSSVSLTYTGWHTHADKQYSGGSWGQVTSNAKVLRRKKSAKSKT